MDFRLADFCDLPQLKTVFGKISEHMNSTGLPLWDEVYPCEFFSGDIEKKQLYLMSEGGNIAAAFALTDSNAGESYVSWENPHGKAIYIERLGVNVDYLRRGLGSHMLKKAIELARRSGAEYLRLFVVDINEPATRLYEKNGFRRVEGFFDEIIDDSLMFHEYGFEIKI